MDGLRAPARGGDQRLAAEIDQVRRAGELERHEGRLGGHEQGGDARAGGQRPDGLPADDADRGANAGAATAGQRVADRQRGVLARRHDHHDRHAEECQKLGHADASVRVLASASMPSLADSSLAALLADVAAATPAPGGGSSAAVACALAAALVEMSAGAPGGRAAELRARALELAQADLGSYAPVLAALRLPADDPERPERLRAALSEASETPLAVAQAGCEVAELAAELARGGRRSLEGDATAGALLAEAATRAAVRLVELNLAGEPGDERLRIAADCAARAWAARTRALGETLT